MSDLMRQIPFGQLMNWALNEYETDGTVFGVRKLFDREPSGAVLPFGPAAGPHTQLAQNLIAAYVAGARFFELKTVQKLDGEDLPVSKPCIYAGDEGYNVEWSTELYVPQAQDEYIKGWFAITLLSRELGLGSENGFIFNMSVGYDLDGIKSPKIDSFIEGLKNAENTEAWKTCMDWVKENLTRFKYVDKYFIDKLSPQISKSITLSTLHGCPPDEIERIAKYLLEEKKLHTFVKCNPTLLGYDYARNTLDTLGFDTVSFDDRHFKADLQFEDCVPMLKRLQAVADGLSLDFGVKLTNTFPVQIADETLPGEEMYMSGRALFPLSIELANRLSKAFDGKLRISFSGGVDARNIIDLYETGISPITVATTLLKPGGYERLHQLADKLSEAKSTPINLDRLQALVDKTFTDEMYRKSAGIPPQRKINEQVPLIDCYRAPCRDGCPFGQDVPAYLRLMEEHKSLEALRVITERNPLPNITGTICSHNCMNKCTRSYYEGSVDIRAVKLAAVFNGFKQLLAEIESTPKPSKTGGKIAIVGGGPAGLAAAYFLARAGRHVTIFEERDCLGGVVRHVIPEFRIKSTAIDNDIKLVLAMGIEVKLSVKITDIDKLFAEGFEQVIVATGAWRPIELSLGEKSALDALTFLEELKRNQQSITAGKNVVVIGGGNTAMDTARAAKRIDGVEKVSLVYRRTKHYMPADAEELELARADGVEFRELLAPVSYDGKRLTCDVMELGAPDSSGRRSPVATGETVEIPADTVIAAVGNKADNSLADSSRVDSDIFIIGDAARGPATVAEAIADAALCAAAVHSLSTAPQDISFDKYVGLNINDDVSGVTMKKGVLYSGKREVPEAKRCLECATVCNLCVDVCPNRANVNVSIDGRVQIVHMDFMCNECGNCAVFCPYKSAPYLDKFTYFIYKEDFENSKNAGFFAKSDGTVRVRLNDEVSEHRDGSALPGNIWQLIEESINKFSSWLA
ncbi:MAG: putative selenate reductase subunit YgfK [Oscillospiraceae bacterium]|nr:putative selenate reductase subunit YgfK [Oscillospiraceae bacterium]